MQDILNMIETVGILPVVEIDRVKDAVPVAKALRDGGIQTMEITLRSICAYDAIRVVSKAYPDMPVGAGTVLCQNQVNEARDAGATYMIAPGFNPSVVRYCLDKKIPFIPGIDSATGIELAIEAGLSVLKFFPAESLGGAKTLKSMAAPFKNRIRFLPLGGIVPEKIVDYAQTESVLAVGGTWIAKTDIIRKGDYARILINARRAIALLHGFELVDLEINSDKRSRDRDIMKILSTVFPKQYDAQSFNLLPSKKGGISGKVRIACNNLSRTVLWLKAQGLGHNDELAEIINNDRKTIVLSLPDGFVVEFIQK